MVADTSRCSTPRRDGSPCRAPAQPGRDTCIFHDGGRQDEIRAARQAGGRNKATPARVSKLLPASLKPTLAALFTALDEVHAGTLQPSQATAMAALAGAISRIYATSALEERLAALEAATLSPVRRVQ
jgi:hypothetical protein